MLHYAANPPYLVNIYINITRLDVNSLPSRQILDVNTVAGVQMSHFHFNIYLIKCHFTTTLAENCSDTSLRRDRLSHPQPLRGAADRGAGTITFSGWKDF